MWPRSDVTVGPGADMTASRRSKAGLSGFVSFMKRRDAEEALREFDGYDWGGSVLRVGWSKAVPLATKPKYGELGINTARNTKHISSSCVIPLPRSREEQESQPFP